MAVDEVRNELLIDLLIALLIAEAHLAKGSGVDVTDTQEK